MKKLLLFNAPSRPSAVVRSHLGSGLVQYPPVARSHLRVTGKDISDNTSRNKQYDKIVAELKIQVESILNGEPISRMYLSIHRDVQLVMLYKHSEQGRFADWILERIDEYLTSVGLARLMHPNRELKAPLSLDDSLLLAEEFLNVYLAWSDKLDKLLRVFSVLDRGYLYQHAKKLCIKQHGLRLFVRKAFLGTEESNNLTSTQDVSKYAMQMFEVCRVVHLHARNEWNQKLDTLATVLFSKLCQLNSELSFAFPQYLHQAIVSNYNELAQNWLTDRVYYVSKVLDSLSLDATLFRACKFDLVFVTGITAKLQWNLLFSDFADTLEPSMSHVVLVDGLLYMHTLVKLTQTAQATHHTNLFDELVYAWGKFVFTQSEDVIRNCKSANTQLVEYMVTLWNDLEAICIECDKNEKLSFELRNAMSRAIAGRDVNRYALQQLSKYCDTFLKQAHPTEEQFEHFLHNTLAFFKVVANKRDFLILYERDVSKRFLLGKNFNLSAEKRVLAAFLNVVGTGDDSINLVSMFKDIDASLAHYSLLHLQSAPRMDFNALILERKFWPELPKQGNEAILPEQFSLLLSEFTAQYSASSDKSKLHVLDWSNYTFHQLTIDVQFARGTKEVVLNLVQAVVLLLFENANDLDIHEVKAATNLDDKVFNRVMTSLSSDKYPILRITGSRVYFNRDFWDKSLRIRLGMGRERETALNDDANKKISKNRYSEIRAALVRVMKQEKTLTYLELVAATNHILLLPASLDEMKVQIDYLLSNEFLRRAGNSNVLTYVP